MALVVTIFAQRCNGDKHSDKDRSLVKQYLVTGYRRSELMINHYSRKAVVTTKLKHT